MGNWTTDELPALLFSQHRIEISLQTKLDTQINAEDNLPSNTEDSTMMAYVKDERLCYGKNLAAVILP